MKTFLQLLKTLFFKPTLAMSILFLLSGSSSWGQIAQRGTATTAISTSASVTVSRPTGVVSGDIMIANISNYLNGTNTTAASSGWTVIAGTDIDRGRATLLYKIAGGSEPTSYTFTVTTGSSAATGAIVAFSGVNTTTPFDVTPATSWNTASSATLSAIPSITTANRNAAVLMFGNCTRVTTTTNANFVNTDWTLTSPASLTELYDVGHNNLNNTPCVGAAWALNPTAGATGNGGLNCNVNTNPRTLAGITIALRPCVIISAGSALSAICKGGTSAALGGSVGGTATGGTWSDGGAGGSFSPNATTLNATYTPSSTYTGTVTLTLTSSGGSCGTATDSKTLTVTAPNAATISYAGTPFCRSLTTQQAVTRAGTTGGTYSSTTGLTINSSTGAITPSTSTAGTYTVTYTMAAAGGCGAATATTSVTITDLPTATISYAGAPFCISNSTAQSVTITGTSGGTYSSTTGLTINSSTGAITPSSSTAGTYTVTYTMAAGSGCSAQTATTSVTINGAPSTTGVSICVGGTGSLSATFSSCPDLTGQTSGPRNAGTGANLTGVGNIAWSNPGNITEEGTPFATVSPTAGGTSNYLFASNYGFSIPANATINGIQLTIRRSSNQNFGGNLDNQVRLVKNNTIEATNKAAAFVFYPTGLTNQSYGSASDLWSSTWTPADINNANFGAVLSVLNFSLVSGLTATVDFMQITVTYTIPGSLAWYTVSSGGTSIGSGSTFNPVGVTNSGLANTNTAGTTPYYVECTTAAGSCRAKADFIIKPSGSWIGATSTDWNTASNWCGTIPTASTDVTIPSEPSNQPIISSVDAAVRSLNIETGAQLTINTNRNLEVWGNWTNNGNFTANSGSVNFKKVGNQAIGGANGTTFNNLIISAGTTTLGVNTSVIGDLSVTAGTLDLGSFTANRSAAGGAISVATGATLKIGGTNTFPSNYTTKSFGSPGIVEYSGTNQTIANLDYADLTLSGSGTKTFPALAVNNGTVASNPILGIGTLRILNNTLKVILPDNSSNDEGNFTGIYRNYRRYRVNDLIFGIGSSGEAIGYYGGSASPDKLSDGSDVIKDFSSYLTSVSPTNGYFYVALGLLPVTLTSFTAKLAPNKTVSLNWATSSETVNKGFRIERLAGGVNGKYESIGFVASKANGGNSQVDLYYNFTDASPRSEATAYYRLAQEDLDGKTTFSEVRVVKFNGETVNMVYPNPSNGVVNISRTATGKKMNVQVIDMAGRMIQQFNNITDSNFKLNIRKSGMYNIKISYPETGEQSTQRIVIER